MGWSRRAPVALGGGELQVGMWQAVWRPRWMSAA